MSQAEPMRVFHCPMCGSGSVTARSDGTIECGYCNTVFTVNVQPSNPGMPQTIDGQPFQPGDPAEMADERLEQSEEDAANFDEDGPEQTVLADEADEEVGPPVDDEEMQVVSLRRVRRMGLRLRRLS